jgi:CRISPR-associated protein Csx14
MAEASIPVDLHNPGQVFACMGFLEAADVLLGGAKGGFDWNGESGDHFKLSANGDRNPFEVVLEFLAQCDVNERSMSGSSTSFNTFPAPSEESLALPVRLEADGRHLTVSHWADGSSRNKFKLYSGNRSAASIASAMLQGVRKKSRSRNANIKNNQQFETRGLVHLWREDRANLIQKPFDVLIEMGGSFNFDPRGGWTAIDAGYSPNDQKHWVEASPVVEILAAIGLEHARPDEFETRNVRYGVWGYMLPPMLARPALGGAYVVVPLRIYRFTLCLAGKNKIVTFAQEETST